MPRRIFAHIFALVILLGGTSFGEISHPTQTAQQTSVSAETQRVAPGGETLLLMLQLPAIRDAVRPTAGLDAAGTADDLDSLLENQARALLPALDRLNSQGLINDYTLLPDLFAVQVRGVTAEAAERLRAEILPQSGRVEAVTAQESTPTLDCKRARVQAFEGDRQMAGLKARLSASGGKAAGASSVGGASRAGVHPLAPIEVWLMEGQFGNSVRGQVAPNIPVTMELWREDAPAARASTTSGPDGYYEINNYDTLIYCLTASDWHIYMGDEVRVFAGANRYTLLIQSIDAWANPFTDRIEGIYGPGAMIAVEAPVRKDACAMDAQSQTVRTAEDGRFSVQAGDFWPGDQILVSTQNDQGSRLYRDVTAYDIDFPDSNQYATFQLPPGGTFIADHLRGGQVLQSVELNNTPATRFYTHFDNPILTGDTIRLTGGGLTLSRMIPLVKLDYDPLTFTASGQTNPGYFVGIYPSDYNNCLGTQDTCLAARADSSGRFSLVLPEPFRFANALNAIIYDDQGFATERQIRLMDAVLHPTAQTIDGTWDGQQVRMRYQHKDSAGNLRSSGDFLSGAWGGFSLALTNPPLQPGDQVEISDGLRSRVIRSPVYTARLSRTTGRLAGQFEPGGLWLRTETIKGDVGTLMGSCRYIPVDGAVDIRINLEALGGYGTDIAYMTQTQNTYLYVYPFSVHLTIGGTSLSGGTETPFSSIAVVIRRDGSLLQDFTMYADGNGYLGGALSQPLLPGDAVQIVTGDGSSLETTVPAYSVTGGPELDQISGTALPNQAVEVTVNRLVDPVGGTSQIATLSGQTGADGRFTLTAPSLPDECHPFRSDGACNIYQLFTNDLASGLSYRYLSPMPLPPEQDGFEPDDTMDQAKVYQPDAAHSFHLNEPGDWTTFDVTEADAAAGFPYRILLWDMGSKANPTVRLYGPDGSTIGLPTPQNRLNTRLYVLPLDQPGRYILEIKPSLPSQTGFCDARYRLSISAIRQVYYLPVIRN